MPAAGATLAQAIDRLDHDERGFSFVGGESGRDMTFAIVRERAWAFARGLHGMGLRKGDRIVLVVPGEEQFIQAFTGAVLAGVIPAPVFPPFMLNQLDSYRWRLELVAQISEAAAVITSTELKQLLSDLLAGTGATAPVISLDEVEDARGSWSAPSVDDKDIALLQFTSGSTGAPRGVCVTHRSLLANANAIADHIHADPEVDRGVSWLPLYHDMGLSVVILGLIKQGSTCYIPPLDFVRRPQVWCETISAVRGTIGFAPNFGYALLARRVRDEELAAWDLSCWRVAGCGAEPIQPSALRAFSARMAPAGFDPGAFFPSYGMAEATLAISFPPLGRGLHTMLVSSRTLSEQGVAAAPAGEEPAQEMVGCGSALAGHEVAIVDEQGQRQPDLHEGEIVFRGPSVTAGYYRDEAATAEVFRDGWLHTQDLGFICEGEVYVTGRKKDLIILRGRNHYPQDIEWCIQDIDGARRGNAVAFSCPDERGEESVVVVVEAQAPDAALQLCRAVTAQVRARLGIVVSDAVVIEKDSLPKTSSGKLQRAETRARYLAESLQVLASSRRSRAMAGVAARGD